jgi:hypothetical protein
VGGYAIKIFPASSISDTDREDTGKGCKGESFKRKNTWPE